MAGLRILICAGALVTGAICCGAVSAGPIDNANEFVEEAVRNAEQNGNAPDGGGSDAPAISWADADSGTDAAVNIGTDEGAMDSEAE